MKNVLVKICGLTTPDAVRAALAGGADYLGFVFCPRSPRHLTFKAADALARPARGKAYIVGVTVNATDDELFTMLSEFSPDIVQLHGKETPFRVRELVERRKLKVIKALPVSEAKDLDAASAFSAADHLLFDAKPPKGADRTGGHGIAYDWSLLADRTFQKPYFLSGGLNPENVVEAVIQSGAQMVDVSSGVESRPGLKDPAKVSAFLSAVKSASSS